MAIGPPLGQKSEQCHCLPALYVHETVSLGSALGANKQLKGEMKKLRVRGVPRCPGAEVTGDDRKKQISIEFKNERMLERIIYRM